MEVKPVVRQSVRAVVETTLYEPDLQPAAGMMERMREGTVAHLARQEVGRTSETSYEAEVPLEALYETDSIILKVTGRADAVFEADGICVIEELKLGTSDSELNPAHMAQAEMYGHMLCSLRALTCVRLMVRYVDTAGKILAEYTEDGTAEALLERFNGLCAPAAGRALRTVRREEARNLSIETLRFPFPTYRSGQKTFSTAVYAAIRDRKRLFAQAPTGIGKTMAAIYPAVHALRQGKCAGILFLSARGTGRCAASQAAAQLTAAGAALYAVEIMAKAKACPFDQQDCNPTICALAKGFYTRLEDALIEAESGNVWDTDSIAALADRHMLCPFELSLEMAKRADLVICDYNYVYDPVVNIDAFLARRGGMAVLVDEAHRLLERVKDDYSVQVRLQDVRELRREAGREAGRKSAVYKALTMVSDAMKQIRDEFQEESREGTPDSIWTVSQENSSPASDRNYPWDAVSRAMQHLLEVSAAALETRRTAVLQKAADLAMDWLYTAERFNERYAFLTDGTGDRFEIGLHLMDAAPEILAVSKRARGTVYFSATLAPVPAAMRLLGNLPDDLTLVLPSPFSPDALSVRILPLDVRYQARSGNAGKLADALIRFLGEHPGNSMVFFPSYAFMDMVAEQIRNGDCGGKQILTEERGMTEAERTEVIRRFAETDAGDVALLCVLGGSFSEGIDLPGDRLRNAAVVSIGLPVMDVRIRAMQAYYRNRGEDGFFYTMTLPGIIRVIQAAGRLIRTETDTGSLLLVDSRYGSPQIRSLLDGSLIGAALAEGRRSSDNE